MEQFDKEKARRVWQRVQATNQPPTPEQDLASLAAAEQAESGFCMQLAKGMQGQDSRFLRQMAMEDGQQGQMLRGICRMTGRPYPQKVPPLQTKGNLLQQLHLCYGRKMQMAAEYEKRGNDPQFGHIFQRLSQQEQAHCRTLLAILGKL